jgi:MFS family permease
MVGLERTVLPVLAQERFGIASATAATSFIVAFGVTKAFTNLFAGRLADRFGRKHILVTGWLLGVSVPLLILWAPVWPVVVAANALLGVNQGLAWSMTVNMKLDIAGPKRRGLVVGLNEAAGYTGLAVVAFATGFLAQPFYLGIGIAIVGLALSLFARETHPSVFPREHGSVGRPAGYPLSTEASADPWGPPWRLSVGGLATNLKDGALWGLLPILLISGGATVATVALVVAAYPLVWGLTQGGFGWWSDRIGRRALVVTGLATQGAGVAWLAFAPGLLPAAFVGLGTAMAYPTLLAAVSDAAAPGRRATALGVYRFWRDMGYAVGALGAGVLADLIGVREALFAVAAVVALAALLNLDWPSQTARRA